MLVMIMMRFNIQPNPGDCDERDGEVEYDKRQSPGSLQESWRKLMSNPPPRKAKVDDQARIGPVDLLALAIQLEFEQLNRKAYQL